MNQIVLNTHTLFRLGFVKNKDKLIDQPDWVFHDGDHQSPFGIFEVPGSEKDEQFIARHFLSRDGHQLIDLYDLYCAMRRETDYLTDILEERIKLERMDQALQFSKNQVETIVIAVGLPIPDRPITLTELIEIIEDGYELLADDA